MTPILNPVSNNRLPVQGHPVIKEANMLIVLIKISLAIIYITVVGGLIWTFFWFNSSSDEEKERKRVMINRRRKYSPII
jgi:flagellar basal body-associated protein FliL